MIYYTAIVLLTITVADCDTGKYLYEKTVKVPDAYNKLEYCRREGVKIALEKTKYYRSIGYSNASTNVKCRWIREKGQPA